MKKSKIIQLILFFGVFSAIGIYISSITYKLVDYRLQTRTELSPNYFVIGNYDDSYFNFSETVYKIVEKAKKDGSLCPIPEISNLRPIAVSEDSRFGVYVIEIVNNDRIKNQECITNVLNEVKATFYLNIEKAIDLIKKRQEMTVEMSTNLQQREKLPVGSDYKKIILSKILNSIEENQIKELGISEDTVIGVYTNGEKFYSKSVNLGSNEYFMKKIYKSNIDFYFLDNYYSRDNKYNEIFTKNELSFRVKLKILTERLNQIPFTITKEEEKEIKLNFFTYNFLILILSNFFAIVLFLLFNKNIFQSLIRYVKKSS